VFIVRNFLILLPVFASLGVVGFDAPIGRELEMPLGWPRHLAVLATGVLLAIALDSKRGSGSHPAAQLRMHTQAAARTPRRGIPDGIRFSADSFEATSRG
jgi:hypothetical protein